MDTLANSVSHTKDYPLKICSRSKMWKCTQKLGTMELQMIISFNLCLLLQGIRFLIATANNGIGVYLQLQTVLML